jgi:iron(III) transport system substrate-binding protein
MVGRGEAALGLTDSDDIAAGQADGYPLAALPLNAESLLIPNSVAIVTGAPHPEGAAQLAAWLQSPAVSKTLIASNALEGEITAPLSAATAKLDWAKALAEAPAALRFMEETFLR